jgi:uncharacterized membrane protein
LADAVPEAAAKYANSLDAVTENQAKIYSFLLSFAVIARLWIGHHRLFEQIKACNHRLILANLGWLLTIVVLPFPTEMIGQFHDDHFTVGLYIGTMLAGSVFLLAMAMIVRAEPALAKNDEGIPSRQRFLLAVNTVILAVALVLAALVPSVGYFALLLLLLAAPIAWIRDRRAATA